MDKLEREKKELIGKVAQLSQTMLQGSKSLTYRTCGKKGCRCRQGRKHGPDLFITWKEGGKTRAYYVAKGREEQALERLGAWREFQELAKRIAQINLEIFRKES